jgi:aspartyl-tRNA(Asn)/glutamyl-tRNA(Gln) amidotransferase subunit B
VEKRGLKQVTDEGALESVVMEVISENAHVVEEFRSGKEKAFGFLVGQVMKKTKGKANPKLANRLLKDRIGGDDHVEQ